MEDEMNVLEQVLVKMSDKVRRKKGRRMHHAWRFEKGDFKEENVNVF